MDSEFIKESERLEEAAGNILSIPSEKAKTLKQKPKPKPRK